MDGAAAVGASWYALEGGNLFAEPLDGGLGGHMAKHPRKPKSRRIIAAAAREVHRKEPAIVAKTRRKKGAAAARKQKVAIILSKARRRGARIPKRK